MSVSKNPFKLILLPQNRKTLIGLLILIILILFVVAFSVDRVFLPKSLDAGAATYQDVQVKRTSQASATGQESNEYKKYVSEFNTTVIATKRLTNPSTHPIPVFENGVTNDVDCVDSVDCVQEPLPIIEEVQVPKSEKSPPCQIDNRACIASKAEMAGCLDTDTACLLKHQIIPIGACALTDTECRFQSIGPSKSDRFCEVDDMACILELSNQYKCALSDTDCLVARGILEAGYCAPADPQCKDRLTTPVPFVKDLVNATETQVPLAQGLVGYIDPAAQPVTLQIGQTSSTSGSLGTIASRPIYLSGKQQQIPVKPVQETKYDQAYMDQAYKFVATKAASRKSVPISINIDFRGNEQTLTPMVNNTIDLSTSPPANMSKSLIRAGAQMFAVSDLALSSDYRGPVALTILESGVLNNAKLLGSMVHLDDKIRLELNKLVLQSGKEFTVSAVALDLETTYAAVASNVDHHYMSRFGWWGFGTVLSAVGNATKLASQQLSRNIDGTITEVIALNSQQQARIALGEIGAEIGTLLRERVNQPVTVHIDKHEEMGVFFLESVREN